MPNIPKKRVYIALIVAIIAIAAGSWFLCGKIGNKLEVSSNDNNHLVTDESRDLLDFTKICNTKINSSDTLSEWETKDTSFFSIKFPSDWCWLELKENPNVYVLTFNSDFDISKYPDISFTYDSAVTIKNIEEVVISFNGGPTSQLQDLENKSTHEIVASAFQSISKVEQQKYGAQCRVKSISQDQSLQVCSYMSNNMNVRSYFISNRSVTISMTAYRDVRNTSSDNELDKIAESIVLK